jgi:hypothetical protein
MRRWITRTSLRTARKIIKRCILYEQIAKDVTENLEDQLIVANSRSSASDVETKELGLVEAADGAWGQLLETDFYLFEELFEICRRPNEAEFDLLGRVLQTDPVEIQQWCKYHINCARNHTNLCCS